MLREIRACLGLLLSLLLLCGTAYPLASMSLGQALFYANAQGSLIGDKGKLTGSSLIGQSFARTDGFQSRPSSAGEDGYDAMRSGASNLSPASPLLRKAISERVAYWRAAGIQSPIPTDLVTGSASGLDPHISPASACFQAESIAARRGIKIRKLNELIESLTEPRDLGFLGEPRVNVLALNRALDAIAPDAPPQKPAESSLLVPLSEPVPEPASSAPAYDPAPASAIPVPALVPATESAPAPGAP